MPASRRRWIAAALAAVAGAACSKGGDTSAPQTSGGGGASPGRPNPAIDALTAQKFRDHEFMAAIAVLETANGTTDASADLAASERRVLGIRQSGGWTQLPGINVPREKLPENVRVVRIEGIIEETTNPHAMRFQNLAMKYAKDYNATMIRGVM